MEAQDRPILSASFSAFLSTTFIHFVYVLVTAVVALVPTFSETVLGGLLVIAGIGSLGHVARHVPFLLDRYRAQRLDRSDLVWYSLLPSVAYVLYLDAGIGLVRTALLGRPTAHALDVLAAANILLLLIGVRNAWDLMVFQVLHTVDTPGDGRP